MTEDELKKIERILGKGSADGVKLLLIENNNPTLFPELEVMAPEAYSGRCSKSEKELRKNVIRKLVVSGIHNKRIIEFCKIKFLVREKTVYKYLKEIHDELREAAQRDTEVNYGLAIERLEDALTECLGSKDMMGDRIKVLKELHAVQGLNTKQTIDIPAPVEVVFTNRTAENRDENEAS